MEVEKTYIRDIQYKNAFFGIKFIQTTRTNTQIFEFSHTIKKKFGKNKTDWILAGKQCTSDFAKTN